MYGILFFFTHLYAVAETATKQEPQQKQQQRVGAFDPPIGYL